MRRALTAFALLVAREAKTVQIRRPLLMLLGATAVMPLVWAMGPISGTDNLMHIQQINGGSVVTLENGALFRPYRLDTATESWQCNAASDGALYANTFLHTIRHCNGTSWNDIGGISWPLLAPDGSLAAPSYSFAENPDSGMRNSPVGIYISEGGEDLIILSHTTDARINFSNTIAAEPTAAWAGGVFVETDTLPGASTSDRLAFSSTILPGYVGSGHTVAGFFSNEASTTGAWNQTGQTGDVGIDSRTGFVGASAGAKIGVVGRAASTAVNGVAVGVQGTVTTSLDTTGKGVGVIGIGPSDKTLLMAVAGYFAIANTPAMPNVKSVLLLESEGDTAFLQYRNRTDPVRIVGQEGEEWARDGKTDLTETVATPFVRVDVLQTADQARVGGVIYYCVDANSATDYQERCGSVPFASVNKAGVETCEVGTPSDVLAASSGTLTVAFTATAGTDACDYEANADSSLILTTLRINFHVTMHSYNNAFVLPLPFP